LSDFGSKNDAEPVPKRYRVGDLVLDAGTHEVFRDGELLDVSGLSWQLLLALVENAPNVLSHDRLVDLVWPGRVISPETVTQRIKLARQAIGDDAQEPRYIGLVRGEGYRILATVEELPPEGAPVSQSLFAELGRRRVVQVALLYVAVAWSITEIISFLIDALPVFPEWSRALVAIVFVVGFPVTMFLAWRFDIGPGGISRTQSVSRRDHVTVVAAMALLVGATASLFYLIYPRVIEQSIVAEAEIIPNSVAVLPFKDLSPESDQAYFAEGVAEEILTRLTSLDDIGVFGRAASFRYNAASVAPVDFASSLGAAYVLDGSVRKDGEDLRITVDLIDAQSGLSVWSQTYNRELFAIFAIQNDIAMSIATALSIALDIEDRDHLEGAGTDNLEAFNAYLAGRALGRVGRGPDAIPYFERAVEIDPEYAQGWAAIATGKGLSSWDHSPQRAKELHLEAVELLNYALELDPNFADALMVLSSFQMVNHDFVGAAETYAKGLAAAPGALQYKREDSSLLRRAGRISESIALREADLDKHRGYYGNQSLIEGYIQVGRIDDAKEALKFSETISPSVSPSVIFRKLFIAITEDNREDVRRYLDEFSRANADVSVVARPVLAEFDAGPDRVAVILRKTLETAPDMTPEGRILTASLAAWAGAPELALEAVSAEFKHNTIRAGRLWYPFFSDMRHLPGFKQLAQDIGLVEYWRAYDWADVCRPLSDSDFECW